MRATRVNQIKNYENNNNIPDPDCNFTDHHSLLDHRSKRDARYRLYHPAHPKSARWRDCFSETIKAFRVEFTRHLYASLLEKDSWRAVVHAHHERRLEPESFRPLNGPISPRKESELVFDWETQQVLSASRKISSGNY